MRLLVVNSGSSSLKLRVLDAADELRTSVDLPAIDLPGRADGDLDADAGELDAGELGAGGLSAGEVRAALRDLGPLDAVGHRVVHGGTDFRAATLVDDGVLERIAALSDLAPLHQPRSVAALRAARLALPDVPHVACFDTAFHATIPDAAATYALPAAWRERWPLRRFGFHGLSHASVARRAADLLGRDPADLRLVTCHLGAGASLTAVAGGRSVDTTMGFTPLEGLVMATRSGNVDPGLLLWLLNHGGLAPSELAEGLEHGSGLLGLAGTADMREVLDAAEVGDAGARLALDVYVYRLRAGIASMAAAMDGLDALVFTGGVGENAPAVRRAAIDGLRFLGVVLDDRLNDAGEGDRQIGRGDAPARILVIASREDLEIARQVRSALER